MGGGQTVDKRLMAIYVGTNVNFGINPARWLGGPSARKNAADEGIKHTCMYPSRLKV